MDPLLYQSRITLINFTEETTTKPYIFNSIGNSTHDWEVFMLLEIDLDNEVEDDISNKNNSMVKQIDA
jgi:hypothetical protein